MEVQAKKAQVNSIHKTHQDPITYTSEYVTEYHGSLVIFLYQ